MHIAEIGTYPLGRNALVDDAKETVRISFMDGRGRFIRTIAEIGQRHHATIDLPRIANVLAATGAVHLFMTHTHPSGDPHPSFADIDTTRRVWRLARALGASLQDHVILGRDRWFSFRANGML